MIRAAVTTTSRSIINLGRRRMATAAPFNSHLPKLDEVEGVSGSVVRVLGGNPSKFTLQGTNTYLLGTSQNRILIDTAQGHTSWSKLLSLVLEEQKATVTTCLITHWHVDHMRGMADLRNLCPDVEIWKFMPGLWDPESSKEEKEMVEGVREIEDGMVFGIEGDGLKVRAVHCPGHTDDHCAFVIEESGVEEEEEGAMFTGDNVLGHGTSVFSDLSTYMSSLELMAEALPHDRKVKAYPGHGMVIGDAKAKIMEYIKHRQQREDEILGALSARSTTNEGDLTAMQIVKVVYKDVPETLHLPAEKGVLQVLAKLEEEGKVGRRSGSRWRLGRGSESPSRL